MGIAEEVLDDVPVNLSKYRETWSGTYRDKFRKGVLQECDRETLELIAGFCDVELDGASSLFKNILRRRDKTTVLFAIYRFISGKKLSVRSLAEKRGDSIVDGLEYRYVLKQIAEGDSDFIYKVYIYHEWSRMSDIYTYGVDSSLPDSYLETIAENSDKILRRLRRKTRSTNLVHSQRDLIQYESGGLVNINRQTSDQARRDYSGRLRRRPLTNVFIEFNGSEDQVRIGTSNTNIRENLRDIIQDILGIFLIDLETNINRDEVDKSQFKSELKRDIENPNRSRILAAEFRRTNVSPSSPVKISKKTYGRDVRPIISALDPDITSVELDNVNKLWLEIEGEPATINVHQSVQESFLRLSTNIDSHHDEIQAEFKNNFHDIFGVPPDKKIPLHWITGDRRAFISSVLKNPSSYDSRKYPNQDLIQEIANRGIVDLKIVTPTKCNGCGNRYTHKEGECPKCGGTLAQVARYEVPRISKPGVREFLKEVLKEEGLEYLGKRRERIFRTEYEFLRVQGNHRQIDIHLNTDVVNLTQNAVEHLQKSLNPVIVVNPGEVKNQALMDEALTASIDLAELVDRRLENQLPSDFISQEVERVERTTEERAARNARSAYDTIEEIVKNPDNSDASRFEEEIFHIVNQILPNAEQWGNKRSGKNVPDGFAEIYFDTIQGNYHKSISYDSKFTEKENVNMDTDETKRLRDYVHRIIESEEVKSSDTNLSHFIIVTNAKSGGMDTLAGRLNRMRKWEGYPVYMHSSFLLGLHLAYNGNTGIIQANQNEFYECLYRTLNGGRLYQTEQEEEHFVSLTGKDVENLMNAFEDESDNSGLDISELREFLETDRFP